MSSLIQVLAKYRSLLLNGTEITLIISVITIVFAAAPRCWCRYS